MAINNINVGSLNLTKINNNNKPQKEESHTPALPQSVEAYSSDASSAMRAVGLAQIKVASLSVVKNASKVQETQVDYTQGINCTVKNTPPSEEVNDWWKNEMGYDNPPYKANTKCQVVELNEDTVFCRVYDGENSGMYGGWVMKPADIEGLSPEEIKDKYALPQTPIKMCDVVLEKGTQIRIGIAGELEWGKGGGIQVDLMGQRVGEFGNERNIPTLADSV